MEKATILPFFNDLLRAGGVRSENDCPTGDYALVECVARAWQFGQRLRRDEPQRVAAVIADLGSSEFEAVADVAEDVLRQVTSLRPVDLTRAIFKWHWRVYRWTEPGYYGQALDRLVQFCDFAIWAAWISKQ